MGWVEVWAACTKNFKITASALLSEETSVTTILNLCPDFSIPRENHWTATQPIHRTESTARTNLLARLAATVIYKVLVLITKKGTRKGAPRGSFSCGEVIKQRPGWGAVCLC